MNESRDVLLAGEGQREVESLSDGLWMLREQQRINAQVEACHKV
jgi:hypothetical protein